MIDQFRWNKHYICNVFILQNKQFLKMPKKKKTGLFAATKYSTNR